MSSVKFYISMYLIIIALSACAGRYIPMELSWNQANECELKISDSNVSNLLWQCPGKSTQTFSLSEKYRLEVLAFFNKQRIFTLPNLQLNEDGVKRIVAAIASVQNAIDTRHDITKAGSEYMPKAARHFWNKSDYLLIDLTAREVSVFFKNRDGMVVVTVMRDGTMSSHYVYF